MSVIVLLHGAWHGGWAWDRVAPQLRAAGHEVYAPTLSGVSDRAHLVSPAMGLETHLIDVVELIEKHDLREVLLVGHSYAGMLVSGVADRIPDRIARRVYLDAFLGEDGESATDLQPERIAGHYAESVAEAGFGWLIPPRKLSAMGVEDPADLDWLTPRLTPHPYRCFTDRLSLTGAGAEVPGTFIECVGWQRVFRDQAERATVRGMRTREIDTGHEAMVTAPDALVELLLAEATD
ncbi:alpha/beta fold hydrolase [Enemella evansiae]|uniref:alpha/beta fold hydrolase n=1 Tax=Enemella evansiae TaxID=2016499 RepID=UPI000B9725BF|nr:alpha/beta hydrolase family protein [Enemella evansiae]OYO03474.1 alpha/beta hydrolase [Enemella evansiae]OYO09898.1 alpha/beta hydrolase [Enemella evansiae]